MTRHLMKRAAAPLLALFAALTGPFATGQDAGPAVTEEQQRMIEELLATGYVLGENPKPENTGIMLHVREKACQGVNVYVSGHDTAAFLMDMDGRILHTWRCPYDRAWPGRDIPEQGYGHLNWRRALPLPDGSLLAVFEGVGLVKLDKDSNIVWVFSGRAHHDLKVMENGDIYVLTRKAHMIPRIHAEKPILEDYITLLDSGGKVKKEVSLLEAGERSPFWPMARLLIPEDGGDIFHANTLEWLDGSRAHLSPLFKRGNILTSFKRPNAVVIVDMETESFVWYKSGPWVRQHSPTLLENGNLLVFDNNRFCDYSRVMEYEPFTERIPWYYLGNPPDSFFTRDCGAAYPLPNGNVLAVESQDGRAFEVTREKEIVWEFVNPATVGEGDTMVAYLHDLMRMPADFPLNWLPAPAAKK